MMKVALMMTTNTALEAENRKRAIQRKEMGEAYRKNQQYQAPKNPMLEALENLLSGKTEKDIHAADQAIKEQKGREEGVQPSNDQKEELRNPQVQAEIKKLEMTEKEVMAHENAHKAVGGSLTGAVSYSYTEGPDNKRYINGGEVPIHIKEGWTPEETLSIGERVKAAALAPAEPSPQDLRVAATATSLMQQATVEMARQQLEGRTAEEERLFADEDLTVELPERFLRNFDKLDATQTSLFSGDLKKILQQRSFQLANSRYSKHMAMVKNDYRSFDEPSFSRTA